MLTLLFSFGALLYGVLWFLLILSMLLLIGVILLQEGKGGGLAEAFGGAGAETFGVKAHGINKFTALVGGVFLVLCVLLTKFHVEPASEGIDPTFTPQPEKDDPTGMRERLRQMGIDPDSLPPPGGEPGPEGAPPTPPPAGGGN